MYIQVGPASAPGEVPAGAESGDAVASEIAVLAADAASMPAVPPSRVGLHSFQLLRVVGQGAFGKVGFLKQPWIIWAI